jgi:hypothetical protein
VNLGEKITVLLRIAKENCYAQKQQSSRIDVGKKECHRGKPQVLLHLTGKACGGT